MKNLTVTQALPLMQHLAKANGVDMNSKKPYPSQIFRMPNQQLRMLIARTRATLLAAEPIAKHLFGIASGTENGELAIRRFTLNSIKNN